VAEVRLENLDEGQPAPHVCFRNTNDRQVTILGRYLLPLLFLDFSPRVARSSGNRPKPLEQQRNARSLGQQRTVNYSSGAYRSAGGGARGGGGFDGVSAADQIPLRREENLVGTLPFAPKIADILLFRQFLRAKIRENAQIARRILPNMPILSINSVDIPGIDAIVGRVFAGSG
jgi:hypothetical protein